ncbi:MAG: hypothetical protein C5B60_04810 [Chloroflexi bacterium]|nr:MAG: hypothetical protein C5B60_04810 [Chloroflexota bacterium]
MKGFLAVAILLAFILPADAIDYYVATTGNDVTGAGTEANPWATPYRAVQAGLTPGDKVHLVPGTYTDHHYVTIPAPEGGGVTAWFLITASGSPDRPITFVSDTKWGAIFDCRGTATGGIFISASYVVFDGIQMTCPGAYSLAAGVYNDNGHVTFRRMYVHDWASTCLSTGAFATGTATPGYTNIGHNVFDGNVIRHIGANSPSPAGSTGAKCNQTHGIYEGSPHASIVNNIVSGVVGFGIHVYGGGVCYDTITNNTAFDNSQGGIVVQQDSATHPDYCSGQGTSHNLVNNNTAVNNGFARDFSNTPYSGQDTGIHIYGVSGSDNSDCNNIVYGNNGENQCRNFSTNCTNNLTGTDSSVFVNYEADKNWAPAETFNFNNYQLHSGSPAIQAGISHGAPATDIVGNPRPSDKPDIGAFQYVKACGCLLQ